MPWNGTPPVITDDIPEALGRGAQLNYAAALYKYCKSKDVFYCVSSPPIPKYYPGVEPQWDVSWCKVTPTTRISYQMNGIATGKTISVCPHTAKTVMFREGRFSSGWSWCRPMHDGSVTQWGNAGSNYFESYTTHFKGGNFVFCDGHVAHVLREKEPDDPNNPFWNFDDGNYIKNVPG
jgi:prepilin-type processing-associated H-X9-DG protein